jgi:signal transduction histidine kinase
MKRFRVGGEQGADLLLWIAIVVPLLLADEPPEVRGPVDFPLLWLEIAAVPLLGVAVALSRRRPLLAAAVPVGLALAATPELFTEQLMVAQLVLSFRLGRRTARVRTGLLFFGAVCLAGVLLGAVTPAATLVSSVGMATNAVLTIMLPWLAGRYARQHDELVRAGWELAERLEREQHLLGERIRLLERSRIASDMHDSLGHELSLIALRAAALQVDPALGQSARKAAGELRAGAAEATQRLHQILSVLREDGATAPVLPSDDTVGALVERAAAAGMAVTLEGDLERLPPMADRAAYRVVQEALTNATKHAPGAPVTVRLTTDSATGEAVVAVSNAAPPAGRLPGTGAAGFGLVGLDERVRLAGGRLRAEPVDGGYTVTARLPLTAGAATAPHDSERELAVARRQARRSMIDAIWAPVVVSAVLLALIFGYHLFASDRSVLDAEVFAQLRVGESQSSVESRLPAREANGGDRPAGAPADPRGTDDCRFYRTTDRSPSPAYRLCFSDGRLAHKDEVPVADP